MKKDKGKYMERKCMACGAEYSTENTMQIYCPDCNDKVINCQYMNMDREEWDGESALSLYDHPYEKFFTAEDVEWYCAEYGYDIEKLRLVICEKLPLPKIDLGFLLEDWIPEGYEIEDIDPDSEIEDDLNSLLNERIEMTCWVHSKYRTDNIL